MEEATIEKLVKEANDKKIFDQVIYISKSHNPDGAYVEASCMEYLAHIRLTNIPKIARYDGKLKENRIILLSVSKFEEEVLNSGKGGYRHLFWSGGNNVGTDKSCQKKLSPEDDTPQLKNFLESIGNFFNKTV